MIACTISLLGSWLGGGEGNEPDFLSWATTFVIHVHELPVKKT